MSYLPKGGVLAREVLRADWSTIFVLSRGRSWTVTLQLVRVSEIRCALRDL